MTQNVENWKYKTRKEVEALDKATLNAEWENLTITVRVFHAAKEPWTDEMFWMFITLSAVMKEK